LLAIELYSIGRGVVAKVTHAAINPSGNPSGSSSRSAGSILGFPLDGFSLFQSLLLSLAAAFFTFFLTTCVAIFSLLVWNGLLHHAIDYADSYRYVGFPCGALVLVLALPFFGALWIRAQMRK
jgi:hypothetical protein